MSNILLDPDLTRLAILLSVILAVLIYNRYGLTIGGAIVPGYLALFVTRPSHILITVGIALLTWALVQKVIRPRTMIAGRRLYEVELLVAFLLNLFWMGTIRWALQGSAEFSLMSAIGFVLPGILAHDMGRQGPLRTLQATTAATTLIFGFITGTEMVRQALGIVPAPAETGFITSSTNLLGAIGFSLIAVMIIRQSRLKEHLGTGGFVTAAYLVMLIDRPQDLLIIVVGALLTYAFVTQVLMKQAIVFGRSKLAAMILTGILMTWLIEFVLKSQFGYIPWPGLYVIIPMMMALLANDTQRRGPVGTFAGAALATAIVYVGTQLTQLFI